MTDIVIQRKGSRWHCVNCALTVNEGNKTLYSLVQIKEHLLQHEAHGHDVPPEWYERIARYLKRRH